jgi:cardiolipin synthase
MVFGAEVAKTRRLHPLQVYGARLQESKTDPVGDRVQQVRRSSATKSAKIQLPLSILVTTLRQFRAAPNLLTMLRLFTLPFLVITILDSRWKLAFALLWIAGVSDGLDGLLARWLKQKTTLGLYLDPIADKLLMSTLFLVLTHVSLIPRYVTVLVFSRDLGILLIATLLFATNTLRTFPPSKLGKLNTVVMILGVLTVMTCQVIPNSGLTELKNLLLWTIAVLAPVSAAEYAWIVIRRVSEPHPNQATRA